MAVGLLSFASTPIHNGGLAQIGLDFQEAYYDIWAVNILKQSLGITTNNATDNNWPALFNSDGYPTALPTGGTWIYSQSYVYGNAGDKWVLDWPGTGNTVAITFPSWSGCTFNENVGERTNNKRTYTIAGTPTGTESGVAGGPMKVTVTISAIGTGFGDVRLYRDSDSSLINGSGATSIYTTEFLNRIKQFGVIRFMDWNRCNTARTYKWDYRRPETAASWTGPIVRGAWYYGAATFSSPVNTYTVSTLPTLTHGLPVQFILTARPARRVVKSVTTGATTNLEITNHGYVTGNRIVPVPFNDGGTAWSTAFQTKDATTGLTPDFTVTRVDANNITIPLNTSSGYSGANAPNTNVTLSDLTSIVGTFTVGETVTGGTTSSTGTVVSFSGTTLVVSGVSGDFVAPEVVTGGTSSAHAAIGFVSPGFMVMSALILTDGSASKRIYAKGMTNHTYSEFGSGKTYPFLYTAVYDATFDCFVMSGAQGEEGDQFWVGAPLSGLVALANYCRAHPWFTFGYMADDDFWTQTVTYVKANLSPGLIPRFETGNEIWNTGPNFWQTSYAQSIAIKYFGAPVTSGSVTAWNLGYARRYNAVCDAIEAVYGTGSDWRMVLGTQLDDQSDNRLKGNATINGGNSARYPANRADYIATAPYTSAVFAGAASGNTVNYPGLLDQVDNYNQGGASRNTAYAWLRDEISTASTLGWKPFTHTLDDEITNVAAIAGKIASYTGRRGTGLPQTHYEGGPLQVASTSFDFTGFPANAPTSGRSVTAANMKSFWLGFLASTYAGQYMRSHMTRMTAAGIAYPSLYTIARPWTADTNQGLIDTANLNAIPTIAAYTELLSWNNGT